MTDQLYRIHHPKTKKYRDIWARDADFAVHKSGWKAEDCEIHKSTATGGWVKVKKDI